MLKKVLIGLIVVLAGLAVVIALQPAQYHVQRSITINAPAAAIFPLINDFHQWDHWSPWAKLDPAMKKTVTGGPGAGSIYTWSGNNDVGEGRMTILESDPGQRVLLRLDFLEPMASTSTTLFTLKPNGNSVTVDWDMNGNSDFMGKAFGLFMNFDKMIGADFEKGLNQLKSLAERQVAATTARPSPTCWRHIA